MTFDPRQKAKIKQTVRTGDKLSSKELDASTTEDIISLGFPAEVVSFQASGTLAGNIEFSLDGTNWTNTTAIPGSNVIGSFSSHLVLAVRVTRTAGAGKLSIAVK